MKGKIIVTAVVIFAIVFTSLFSCLAVYMTLNTMEKINPYYHTIYHFGTNNSSAVVVFNHFDQYGFVDIKGSSMEPTIKESNTVIVEKVGFFGIHNIIRGDIIVFSRDGNLICHRVVAVNSDSFAVKGDANAMGDSDAVPFSDVQAVVIAIFR